MDDDEKLINAAHEFVASMMPRADSLPSLTAREWALREAFIAGAVWREENLRQE
jgi:hypothetical protein